MDIALRCELREEGVPLPASMIWSLEARDNRDVLDVLVTVKLPDGDVQVSTAFYRRDIAGFADAAAALAETLMGQPHVPGYEPVDYLMLYVVDREHGVIGVSGQFHSHFLYDKGQTPDREVADSLGPFCLGVQFQAFLALRASVAAFARDLRRCAQEC
jgi:hypothetical protein